MFFKGKQGLSRKSAEKIVSRLVWNEEEKDLFCHLVVATDARSAKERVKAIDQVNIYLEKKGQNDSLSEERFQVISSWQHFALIELMKTEGFY